MTTSSGDIIVFRNLVMKSRLYKRLIGLPGDTVHLDGRLYINDKLVIEKNNMGQITKVME